MFVTLAISTILIGQCGPNGCYAPAATYTPIVQVSTDPEWQPVASNAQQLALMAGGKQLGVYELDSEKYFALVAGKWTEQPAPPIAPPARSVSVISPVGDGGLSDVLQQRMLAAAEKRADAAIEKHVAAIAKAIDEYDPKNPKKEFAIGAILAVAISGLVVRVVSAIITAILVAIIWAWFKQYILWAVGVAAVALLGIIGISSAAGAHAGRKAAGR